MKLKSKKKLFLLTIAALLLTAAVGVGVYAGDYYRADETALAAYSTEDLTQTGLEVLSLYGTADGVLDREKYQQYRTNLPENVTEVILDGGCHACFGSYGPQAGDGEPTITAEEQTGLTAAYILELMNH